MNNRPYNIEIRITNKEGDILSLYNRNIDHDYTCTKRVESALCMNLINGFIDDISSIIKQHTIRLLKEILNR